MAAIMNGVALHGGFHPGGGTFLTFSDYSRNAHPHGGADEAARDRMCSRTTASASARTAHAPVDRACRQPAPDPQPGRLAARPTPPRLRSPGRAMQQREHRPTRCCSEPNLRTTPQGPFDAAPAERPAPSQGATCWPSPSDVGAQAAGGDHRHRLRGPAGAAAQAAGEKGIASCASSRCPAPPRSTARRRLPKSFAVLPPACRCASRSEAGVTDGWWKYGCAAVVGIDTYGESAPAGAVQAISASRRRTWPTPCRVLAKLLMAALGPGNCSTIGRKHHGDKDRHQRLRPHRAVVFRAAPRAELRRTSRSSASTTCSSRLPRPTCCSTTACTAASRASHRSTATR